MRERRDETEFAQFRCHERMHGTHHGAASQKIHAAAAQLAGARSGKDETPPLVLLHQRMHQMEQFGNSLHFINDHGQIGPRSLDNVAEPFRTGRQFTSKVGLEQIKQQALGKRLAQPRGLPRTTGKTTWLRQAFPQGLLLDLLEPDLARELAARPERLRDVVEAARTDLPVIIDEVQRIPELLHLVHALMEENKRRRFILTGSSARKLRRGGVNLLAGRAVVRTMHPFMAAELREFRLVAALAHGLLPLVVTAADPKDVLRAYASLYLDEEVRFEGWTRNIGAFARFLETISFSQASVLNVANVARECQIERKTVAGYIEILEDLLLSFRLPVFTRRAKRGTIQHPKFYFFDAGVYRSLRPAGPLDRPEEIEGAVLEGLVAQHLRAWIAYR